MSPAFYSSCRFIHHWIGYIFAFPFFILCFTGSIALFQDIIQEWMQPQTVNASTLTPLAIQKAGAILLHTSPPSFLRLPTDYDPIMRLWHYDGHIFQGIALNPNTGEPYPLKDVVGGSFFVTLHSAFYMPKFWGRIGIFFCAIAFMLILFSGIILQLKRFLPDLLLYRPYTSLQRSTLDLHLLSGTLSVPLFGFIIISSLFLSFSHLPLNYPIHSSNIINAPFILPQDFNKLYKEGQNSWDNLNGSFFIIFQKKLYFYAPDQQHFCLTRNYLTKDRAFYNIACPSIKSFMIGLHDFRWAGLHYRIFYGLTGILGCILSITALEFFLKKQIKQIRNKKKNILLFILPQLHKTLFWGLPLATLFLLISTRLPTPPFYSPISWQVNLFFFTWIGTFFIPKKLPSHLFILTSLIFPFIDISTRPPLIKHHIVFEIIDTLPIFISLFYIFLKKRL